MGCSWSLSIRTVVAWMQGLRTPCSWRIISIRVRIIANHLPTFSLSGKIHCPWGWCMGGNQWRNWLGLVYLMSSAWQPGSIRFLRCNWYLWLKYRNQEVQFLCNSHSPGVSKLLTWKDVVSAVVVSVSQMSGDSRFMIMHKRWTQPLGTIPNYAGMPLDFYVLTKRNMP